MSRQFLKDVTTEGVTQVIVDSNCIEGLPNTLLSDTLNELKKRGIGYEESNDLLKTSMEYGEDEGTKRIFIISNSTQYRRKIAKIIGRRVDFYSPLNLKKIRDKRNLTYVALGIAALVLTIISINNYDIKRELQSDRGLIDVKPQTKHQVAPEKSEDKEKERIRALEEKERIRALEKKERESLKSEKKKLKTKIQISETIYREQQRQARVKTERKIERIINGTQNKLLSNLGPFYKETFAASSVTKISKLYLEDVWNKLVHKKNTNFAEGKINSLTNKYFTSIMLEGERQVSREINLYIGSTKEKLFNRSVEVIGEFDRFNTQNYTTISAETYIVDTVMLTSTIKKNINSRVLLVPLSIFDLIELSRTVIVIKKISAYLGRLVIKRLAKGGAVAAVDGNLPIADLIAAGIFAWTIYDIKEAFFDFRSELEIKLKEDILRYADQSKRERKSNLDSVDKNFSELNKEMTNKSLAKLGV
ncbi:hypothetical protein PM10SUCC1_28250 [Propionigenium maris DSM 9537]|uniref:Uncharacterized protein n=1 Tax=Propionigenium maris DSM 9537 TaxID=1123000 RepID=A0A9W6GP09_9FUSO|nr:hypothetical protein [Propionigenium maris]GLI57311.1 hypothetical protein PM10SUCC1_28250 [Propionigenium maris DSM 9537]